jgi:hypothetical protein
MPITATVGYGDIAPYSPFVVFSTTNDEGGLDQLQQNAVLRGFTVTRDVKQI